MERENVSAAAQHAVAGEPAAKRGSINIEQLLPGYAPVSDLWQCASPVFTSEYNARWFLRRQLERLVALQAIVHVGGRYYFHRARFSAAVEKLGAEEAGSRSRRGPPLGAALQTR